MSGASTAGRARGRAAPAIDYFFAVRPLLWIPAIAVFEAGRAAEGGGRSAAPLLAWPSLLSLLAILGAVHLANGWNDRAGDRINEKGGPVARGAIGGRGLALAAALLLLLASVLAASPFVTSGARWLLAAALALGAAYTLPPFEWKRRAGLDLFGQAIGYGVVAYRLGAEAAGASSAASAGVLETVPYAFAIGAVGTVTMLADRAGDAAAGQRTTVVALGAARSETLAIALSLGAAASGLALGAWAVGLAGMFAVAVLSLRTPAGAAGWNRAAIEIQAAFLLLLLVHTLIPFVAAVVLGAAVSVHDRARGGRGYPWRVVAGGEANVETAGGYRTTRV